MWGLNNTGQASTSGGNPGTPGQDIHAEGAWDITTGSKSVVVGIVDEGIDINHEDLHDNIWVNTAEIPGNGIDDDGNGYVDDINGWDFAHNDNTVFDYPGSTYPPADTYDGDVDDHGTHVAGTIGAMGNNGIGVVGVNWQVSMMSLKFLTGVDGFGTTSDLLKALNYAKSMRALWVSSGGTKGANIRVLNNSYGGPGYSQAEYDAIQALSDAGILFVAAAGNESSNNDVFPSYPASYQIPNIISVAASTGGGQRASFSNAGSASVDMTAPGNYILSTTPKNTYEFFSGTSMATPHVTGAAALLCAANASLSLDKLRSTVIYTGYVTSWQYQYVYPISSGRSLNAAAALQSLSGSDTTAPAAAGNLHFNNGPLFPNYNLQWQAPGDDGNTGTVAAYEVRFSDSDPSNESTFDHGIPLPGPIPDVAGTGPSVTIQVPWRHASGFVGVRAIDEAGNKGPISTLAVPIAAGAGDPYIVTESAAAPLSTGGTPLGLNVDDGYKQVTLPVGFKFYEGSWGQVTVSSNGALYFGFPPSQDYLSYPGALNGYRIIAGAWDDLRMDHRAGDDVYVVKPDENRIIFRWQAVTYDTEISPGVTRGENPVNFEIELDSDGTIITRYGDGNHNLIPVVGLGGGFPEPYVIDSHTSVESLKDLTNAAVVTYQLRNPPNPPTANLSLTVTNGPNPVSSGFTETYNAHVFNDGPYSAPNTVITDTLPTGLTFVSCTTNKGTCSGPAVGASGTITVNVGELDRFNTVDVTIVATASGATGTAITNTISVNSSRFDSDMSNNSVTRTVTVSALSAWGDVSAITASYFVNFAVTSDGRVWGWGNNDYGTMVLGTGDTSSGAVTSPVQTQTITGAVAVSTGGSHTLALKGDGTVWSWGANFDGQGGGASPPYPLTPHQITGLSNVTAVSAGYPHSMALKNDGTVWIWGGNENGQLGLGTTDNNPHPTPIQVPGLTNVTAISAGTNYSVVVKNDGTVWAWGTNLNGEMGDNSSMHTSPVQVNGVTGAAKVSAGYNHVLIVKTDGTVMGWGANQFGQTGSSNFGNVNPTPSGVSNLTNVVSVASGFGFSLALKSDGTVWGWGLNASGQLGNGTTGSNPQTNPTQVSNISTATAIAAGNTHGVALLGDKTLRTWGDNSYGQLGDGTTFTRTSPVPVNGVPVVAPPSLSPDSATGYGPVLVTVSSVTPGATLHYTTNSLDPTENDPIIASGSVLSFSQYTILKVRAYKLGWMPSAYTTGIYNVSLPPNPIDVSDTFVKQHYRDFLNREADPDGLQFWTNNIESCGADTSCREVKRIDTSAAFFLSIEFQETGYLVHRFYRASFGTRPLYNDFLGDTQAIGVGVIVNAPGWQQKLESNKQAFMNAWVQRATFKAIYDGLSNAEYVDKLITNTSVAIPSADREALVNALNGNTKTRAEVLRAIAEHQLFYNAEYNPAFVEMEYFGYLRRDPDEGGFNFWLNKLNEHGGDFRRAEMVKSFIVSGEYRDRFVTH